MGNSKQYTDEFRAEAVKQEADDLFFGKAFLHVQSPGQVGLDSNSPCYSKPGGRRGIARSYGVLGWSLWRWRAEQVSQLDHDMPLFRTIIMWLIERPTAALEEHQRMARLALAQMSAKIGMFTGGLERLGVLPVLVSAWLFFRHGDDLLSMPAWQLILGFGLIVFYFAMMVANLMRIRLQIYESLLSEALAIKHES